MGALTTHILDTCNGGPAEGVAVRLFRLDEQREELVSMKTDADGRTRRALLGGDAMTTGTYELEFDIGRYFRGKKVVLGEPAFLDTVVIRFSIRSDESYHVPLLVSPWSYSTYRGS